MVLTPAWQNFMTTGTIRENYQRPIMIRSYGMSWRENGAVVQGHEVGLYRCLKANLNTYCIIPLPTYLFHSM